MENSASPSTPNTNRRRLLLVAALVLLACVLAYGVALNGPLFFDDEPNLLKNRQVQIDGASFDSWRVAVLSAESGLLLRPVAMLSFALNHALAGAFTPFSLKATNLALHLLIGALLYLFALAVLQAPALRVHRLSHYHCRLIALLAASIWLLHPLHVSTVLYAVQRMAQLSTLFTLAGLLVFIRYRLRWADAGATPGELLAAALWVGLLGVLAVLSKENGALLPWLIAVLEVTLFRGVWRGQSPTLLRRLGWLVLVLPLLLAGAIYLVAPEAMTGRYGGREFTLAERLLTQPRVLWQYLGWMLLPNVLEMGVFHDDIAVSTNLWTPLTTALSLFAWAAVLLAAAVWHRRWPLLSCATLFYLVAHSMESSVWPLEMVFEHRNYLPCMGFAVLAALGLFTLAARIERLPLRLLTAGVLGLLVVLLAVRTTAWTDELSLARFNVINHPQSPRANFFYGNALFKRFQQSRELGLDEEEQRALAVTSRRYFDTMRALDGRSFSALVMLYQLDTLYFPGLAQKNDWLGEMASLANTRRLQSSDRTALGALVEFSLSPPAEAGRARVSALLEQLVARYPSRVDIVNLQYRFVMATAPERKPTLLPMLKALARLNQGNPQAAALLASYYGTGDLAGTYGALLEWLRRDPMRRHLPVVRALFEEL